MIFNFLIWQIFVAVQLVSAISRNFLKFDIFAGSSTEHNKKSKFLKIMIYAFNF